jgi:hypothetical protein
MGISRQQSTTSNKLLSLFLPGIDDTITVGSAQYVVVFQLVAYLDNHWDILFVNCFL